MLSPLWVNKQTKKKPSQLSDAQYLHLQSASAASGKSRVPLYEPAYLLRKWKMRCCPQQGWKIRKQKHPEKHENCWCWQRSRLRARKMDCGHKGNNYFPHNVDYIHNVNSPHGYCVTADLVSRMLTVPIAVSVILVLAWTKCGLQSVLFIAELKIDLLDYWKV